MQSYRRHSRYPESGKSGTRFKLICAVIDLSIDDAERGTFRVKPITVVQRSTKGDHLVRNWLQVLNKSSMVGSKAAVLQLPHILVGMAGMQPGQLTVENEAGETFPVSLVMHTITAGSCSRWTQLTAAQG